MRRICAVSAQDTEAVFDIRVNDKAETGTDARYGSQKAEPEQIIWNIMFQNVKKPWSVRFSIRHRTGFGANFILT